MIVRPQPVGPRIRFRPHFKFSAWAILTLRCISFEAAAAELQPCERDNMPLETMRACASESYKPGLTSNERARVFTLRGMSWMREEEPTAAISDFSRAIEINPQNIAALSGRARAHDLLGQHDMAIGDWTRIIEQRPDAEENYRFRAESHLAAGKVEDARADYTKAIAINSKNIEAYIGRAKVFETLNDRKSALGDLSSAQQLAPNNFSPYLALAEAANRWGENAMAIENYKLVLRYNPSYWQAIKALQQLGDNSR